MRIGERIAERLRVDRDEQSARPRAHRREDTTRKEGKEEEEEEEGLWRRRRRKVYSELTQ